MATVSLFRSSRKRADDTWKEFIKALDVPIHNKPIETDVSIVLQGIYENPLALYGKKVLAFDAKDWFQYIPVPHGWDAWHAVLEEYYDEFINLTLGTTEEKMKMLKGYINETQKS